jgi:hypothetical protein
MRICRSSAMSTVVLWTRTNRSLQEQEIKIPPGKVELHSIKMHEWEFSFSVDTLKICSAFAVLVWKWLATASSPSISANPTPSVGSDTVLAADESYRLRLRILPSTPVDLPHSSHHQSDDLAMPPIIVKQEHEPGTATGVQSLKVIWSSKADVELPWDCELIRPFNTSDSPIICFALCVSLCFNMTAILRRNFVAGRIPHSPFGKFQLQI